MLTFKLKSNFTYNNYSSVIVTVRMAAVELYWSHVYRVLQMDNLTLVS